MSHTTEFKSFDERERWYKVVQAALQSARGPGMDAANGAIEVADTVLEADRSRQREKFKELAKELEEQMAASEWPA